MEEHGKINQPYALMEQIIYADAGLAEFVTLERIQKISDKRYAVEITFGLGPL